MIIMRIVLDNFFIFTNFELTSSYPKKIIGSTIEEEWLPDRPNFRYKKLIVVMGTNASGKTTLGKALMGIFHFIGRKGSSLLTEMISNPEHVASFTMDFIPTPVAPVLYRVSAKIFPPENDSYTSDCFEVTVTSVPIGKNDNYEICKARLDSLDKEPMPIETAFDQIPPFGWNFTSSESKRALKKTDDKEFLHVLQNVLGTLDPSIVSVERSKEADDAYVICLHDRSLVLQEETIKTEDILSSGTKTGLSIARLLASIMTHENGFYYCDETFSYVHSEIEQEILSKMIEKLGPYEQLFFTTHNRDLLDMSLPNHSFLFLKKEEQEITPIYADAYLKRNTDSLRKAVENDLFAIAPDVGRIGRI